MKCDTCLNSRCIISENGLHPICTLPPIRAKMCMLEKNNEYVGISQTINNIHIKESNNEETI